MFVSTLAAIQRFEVIGPSDLNDQLLLDPYDNNNIASGAWQGDPLQYRPVNCHSDSLGVL
eukprot:4595690-Prorocentrum_lima.AAC.1